MTDLTSNASSSPVVFVGFAAAYDDNAYGEDLPQRVLVRLDRKTFDRLESLVAGIELKEISSITTVETVDDFRWLKAPLTQADEINIDGFFAQGRDPFFAHSEFSEMDLDESRDGEVLYRSHPMSEVGLKMILDPGSGDVLIAPCGSTVPIASESFWFASLFQRWDDLAEFARNVFANSPEVASAEGVHQVKVAVAGHNASGEPDVVEFDIDSVSQRQRGG